MAQRLFAFPALSKLNVYVGNEPSEKVVLFRFNFFFSLLPPEDKKKNLLLCGGLCLADRNTAQVILKMDFRHYVAFKMYEGGGVGGGTGSCYFLFY